MRHGDICWVEVTDGQPLTLARYTQIDDFEPYWAFFGTDWTCRADQVGAVRPTDLRDVG